MGTIIVPTKTDTTKTTCIEITSKSYKCIDISAFVPQCITITSNVPTSDLYQEQYDREEVEITEAPMLKIALINNETPILNVNMDEDGVYYVTDFDTVYIDITNWNANAEYVNVFSNQDGNEAVVFLDEAEQRIIWALDDWAFDGTQMWLNAQAKESDKLISPQSSVTVMQMEQTDQPILSGVTSAPEQYPLQITIANYDETYTYGEPIVSGGSATRVDDIITWTLPAVLVTENHTLTISAKAPLMYENISNPYTVSVVDCAYSELVGTESIYDDDQSRDAYIVIATTSDRTLARASISGYYEDKPNTYLVLMDWSPPPYPYLTWDFGLLSERYDQVKTEPQRQSLMTLTSTVGGYFCDNKIIKYTETAVSEIYPMEAKSQSTSGTSLVVSQSGYYRRIRYAIYRWA